jgi:hypothetical protein
MSEYRLGFGLLIGFIEHLHIVTASNYSANANSHTLQFTTASMKSSQSAVFTSRCLVADPKNVLCFRAHVLTGWQLSNNSLSWSELLYDGRFIANQYVLAPSPLRLTT